MWDLQTYVYVFNPFFFVIFEEEWGLKYFDDEEENCLEITVAQHYDRAAPFYIGWSHPCTCARASNLQEDAPYADSDDFKYTYPIL